MSRELILQDVKSFLPQGQAPGLETRGRKAGGNAECAGEDGEQRFKNAALTPGMMGTCQPHAKC